MKISSLKVAFTYAGCIVGAGFLSGQELWQFFGSYGKLGLLGFILAIILQAVICYVILVYAKSTKIYEFDKLIIKKDIKPLRWFFIITELIFIFSVVMIMFAGSGSLIETTFGLNNIFGSLIFAILVVIVAFLGLSGMVKVLSLTIPVLTVLTFVICILSLDKYGFPTLTSAEVTGKTLLMPNFVVALILFSVHNIFCTLGVLAPLGNQMENNSTALKGMSISSIVFIIITLSVLLPIYSAPEFAKSDLPMLDLAKTINPPLFYIYAMLLLIGMFGSALSHFVSMIDFSCRKSSFLNKHNYIFIIILAILAFVFSRFGFATLISIMYPLSGYIGAVALVLIVYYYIKLIKTKKL